MKRTQDEARRRGFTSLLASPPPSLPFIPPLIAPPGRTITPKCFLSSLPFFYREITTVVTHLVLVWNTFTFISSQMRKQPPRRDTHTHTHIIPLTGLCGVEKENGFLFIACDARRRGSGEDVSGEEGKKELHWKGLGLFLA